VRISLATSRLKHPPAALSPVLFHNSNENQEQKQFPILLFSLGRTQSAPAPNVVSDSSTCSSLGVGSSSTNSLTSGTIGSSTGIISLAFVPATSEKLHDIPAQITQHYANGTARSSSNGSYSVTARLAQDGQEDGVAPEDSWKHHVPAQAISENLIGSNREQPISTDPYNTTVFVGGLSPLISEETLRAFFAPFGDLHYVRHAHFNVNQVMLTNRRFFR